MSILRPYTGKDRAARRTVTYRDASGRTTIARVVAANGGANLDLYDPVRRRTITNVAPATAPRQTNVWYAPKTA